MARLVGRIVVAVVSAMTLAGCTAPPPSQIVRPVSSVAKTLAIDRAISQARRFLISQQRPDGAWRSDAYHAFQDGASLTPLALSALCESNPDPTEQEAWARGAEFLVTLVPDPNLTGINYPVYTAALIMRLFSRPGMERFAPARDRWQAVLRERQLDEALDWVPTDAPYGGWGYCQAIPRKPRAGEFVPQLLESNLSATVFALDALRAAGIKPDDPVIRTALVFVERCQNYSADGPGDSAFDDGGFHFIYADGARNKAGISGHDRHGRERYFSYGSTTADGFRALLDCGLPPEHPRVVAARAWLVKHADAKGHPGPYVAEREHDRDGVYYYWCWSATQLLNDLPRPAATQLARQITDSLLSKQAADGSFRNPCKAVREDDPVLATSLVTLALARIRAYLP